MTKKICKIHGEYEMNKERRCLDCKRDLSKEWNRKNREHCREKNKKYSIENKERISQRKSTIYKDNPEKAKICARKTALKIKYNLTIEEYEMMLLSQSGVCKICLKSETQRSNKNGKIDSLRVDHCHRTDKIRGLLCSKCNFGIGHFNDDIKLLEKAIKYLNSY